MGGEGVYGGEFDGPLAQLARAPRLHRGGWGIVPLTAQWGRV